MKVQEQTSTKLQPLHWGETPRCLGWDFSSVWRERERYIWVFFVCHLVKTVIHFCPGLWGAVSVQLLPLLAVCFQFFSVFISELLWLFCCEHKDWKANSMAVVILHSSRRTKVSSCALFTCLSGPHRLAVSACSMGGSKQHGLVSL